MHNARALAWLPKAYTVPGFLALLRDVTSWARRRNRKQPTSILEPAKRLFCAWLEGDTIIMEFEDGHRETGHFHRAQR